MKMLVCLLAVFSILSVTFTSHAYHVTVVNDTDYYADVTIRENRVFYEKVYYHGIQQPHITLHRDNVSSFYCPSSLKIEMKDSSGKVFYTHEAGSFWLPRCYNTKVTIKVIPPLNFVVEWPI
ncbi:MAG: hypothetical protein CVU52_10830 [Deltaproteobacteria bacterium HGW-Deltaproteobacteria-10]|nr:MAG: hypothetical protein CVU52_10830 [Deltaproteobacteria bacterium HGW-Deltaproteobacteria-10]